ncbi:MAG: homocysteine methyltransferase [Acidobacteria bacterium]|nr:homocysteine methyltransferase [Acidobacteriota bacterium]
MNTVLDLIEAFRRSKVMFAAVKLGVFDRTPITAERLAAELPSDPRATALLLDACVSLQLLHRDEDLYRNSSDADRYLRKNSPETVAGYVLYSNDVLWRLWAHLDDAVVEGSNRWPQAFGTEGPIFSHFFKTEESMRTFLMGLHGLGQLGSPAVVAVHGLATCRHFVDLGGGTGHLALAFLDRYPHAKATVFDLPNVIPLAREMTRGRVECIAGDFFADPLPPADCYAVSRILHDWSEAKIAVLLDKIHAALPENGVLLIGEMLLDGDRRGPVAAFMQSVNMLTCTEGRERTAEEYEALCRRAGFREFRAIRTGNPSDSMLAVK